MYKSVIIYLSYTGNTKAIAQAIHSGLSKQIEQCDMVHLRNTNPDKLSGYDLIGIGSPVRLGNLPIELRKFIAVMKGLKGKHCFIFNTHAALPVGFMKEAVRALSGQGLLVIGFKNWYCSVFLPYVPKPYFTDEHPDEIDLAEAEEFGSEMVTRSRRIAAGETGLIQKLPEGKQYDEIYGSIAAGIELPDEVMKARAQGFSIDMDKCTQCNLCVQICPSDAIDFSKDPPEFKKCDQCWLCEQICPVGAIHFNYAPLHRSHNIVVENAFLPALEAARKAGRFRQKVKNEEVGWETPTFITKKHPRFKITDMEIYLKKT